MGPLEGKRETSALKWLPIDALTQPQPRAAYEYWSMKRRDLAMPQARSIDPTQIPRQILSYLLVMEVLRGPPADYLYRLEGDVVRQVFGMSWRGKRLSELRDQPRNVHERTAEFLGTLCAEKIPLALQSPLPLLNRGFYTIEVLALPFSQDGDRVDQILTCIGVVSRP